MEEQAKVLKDMLGQLGKLYKKQERNLENALKNIPKDQQEKYKKMVSDAKKGKLNMSDIQNIVDDHNNKP